MSRGTRRTLAAALATLLGMAVLVPVLHGQAWVVRGVGAVAVVAAAGLLSRSARLPVAVQPVLSLLVLAVYLLVVFVPGTFEHGLPSGRTLDAVQTLVDAGRQDLRRYAPPVVPRTGLLLLVTAGIGLVALMVDLLAVTLDRVVLSGLPLLALFAVPSSVLSGGIGGLAFVIGASGWLLLLLEEGGDRTEQWGPLARPTVPGARVSADDGGQARVGRRVSAAALGLAVLVPSFVPGLEHGLTGTGAGNGESSLPSAATTYNPITRLRDQLTLPTPRQLFVYKTDDPEPDYVRMTTLDTYTRVGWQSSELEADPERARVQNGVAPGLGEDGPSRDVSMRLAVDGRSLDVHWLPLPYGPRSVDVEGTWLWDPTSQTAFSASRTTRDLPPYQVKASRAVPDAALLDAAGTDYPPALERYLATPRVTDVVLRLAQEVVRGAGTPYARAVAIQQWFTSSANGFVYDLTPSQPAPGQDALEAFLTGKHGFCQQYATAMAVLLRLSGVPARVAVGFTSGQAVEGRDGTYRVTTSDAHAWPEAFFPGTGWVRFEPTPGAATATTPGYTLATRPGQGAGPTPSPTPRATASAAPRQFKDPDQLLRPEAAEGGGGTGTTSSGRTPWLPIGLAVALLAALPSAATALRRRARAGQGDPQTAWEQLQDDATDSGRVWLPSASPRATTAGLREGLPASAVAALERLAQAVEVARYAPAGRAAAAGDVVADGTAVRRALLATAPRTTRWRARVLTPSTLRWAGHAVGERVADLLDAVDRGLAWAGRPLRRVLRAG